MKISNGLNYLKSIISITSGIQKQFYEWQLNNAKIIKISETPKNIKTKRILAKDCYKNSFQTVDNNFNLNIKYVEGIAMFKGIPIEHAWNKIDDIYFDVTSEEIFNINHFDEYISLMEIDCDEMMRIANELGTYGPYLKYKFKN